MWPTRVGSPHSGQITISFATGTGGLRYPFTTENRRSLIGLKPGENGAVSTSLKDGGDQIEYVDQDPRIHRIWLAQMKKTGAPPRMDKWVPTPADRDAAE